MLHPQGMNGEQTGTATGVAAPADGGARPVVVALHEVAVVRDRRAILAGIDWEVRTGQRWVVLGPNGSGKSTLLKVAGMQLLPTRGTVTVLGGTYGQADVRSLRRRIAFVSQTLLRSLRPELSTHDLVLTGRFAALEPWWHQYSADDHRRAKQLLAAAGLGGVEDQPLGVLSEGERQRALLVRALMGEAEVLLLDEPAAGLDLGAREQLVGRLAALAADPAAAPLVLVTHHLEEVPPGTTHAALLCAGRMVGCGPAAEVLTSEAVSACFGCDLVVSAVDGRWSARAR